MNYISTLEERFCGHLKNSYNIVNMNSKLLYSHFRHEGKNNGKIKLEKHSHKKGKYRLQHEITHEKHQLLAL